MKLWKLRPIDDLPEGGNPWNPWYDKSFGFVVRAESEEVARFLAADNKGDEGAAAWTDPRFSTCVEISQDGEQEVLLRDFASA